jgi:hypothetical protein
MKYSPEAVYIYIPLMKELGMSWNEIRNTPRHELEGIIQALGTFNRLHAFDGYTQDDISKLAKDKPELRSQYSECMDVKDRMERRAGKELKKPTFAGLIK